MGQFILAPEVTVKKRLKKTGIISVLFFLLLLMIVPEKEWIKTMIPMSIFIYMIIEDIDEKTVDIRLCLFLAFTIFCLSKDQYEFVLNFLNGYVFFSFYFLVLSIKYPGIKNDANLIDATSYQFFLPFIGGGIFIWEMIKIIFSIPCFIELTAIDFLPITFIWLLVWGCLACWVKKRKRENPNLIFQEVFGRGDFYICVIVFAIFGLENCLIMLLIAFLLFGIYVYITKKMRRK